MSFDEWTPAPPQPPSPPSEGLPPANSWNPAPGCSTSPTAPSIVASIIITNVPATILAPYAWRITLNDGGGPPNFSIDHLDASGNLIDSPLTLSGVDGTAQFATPVLLSRDPVEPMEAVTKEWAEANLVGVTEAPATGLTYGREGSTQSWNVVTTEAPGDGQIYARNRSAWVVIQPISDAPNDGNAYVRQSLAWAPLSAQLTGYMPLTGGTFTGPVTFTAPNGVLIGGAAGTPRGILGVTGNAARWQMLLGDTTPESGANSGSNFALNPISDTGALLPTALSVARASGAVTVGVTAGVTPLTLNGAAGTWRSIAGSTNGSLRWQMYLGNPTGELGSNFGSNFQLNSYSDAGALLATPFQIARQTGVATFSALPSFPGGSAGNILSTDGAGTLSWAPPGAYTPMGDNRIINGDMRIDQRWNGASGSANNVYTVDRWQYAGSQADRGSWGRNATGGVFGFQYCLSFASSSAYTPVANDAFAFVYNVEADSIGDFMWGTARAQPVTLSFAVFSSVAGTFSASISNYANTRSYPFTYSIPAANAWAQIIVTIPGDASGTWVMSGSGGSLILRFDLGSGATYRGPANAWSSTLYVGVTGAVSVVATNGATFNLTGVKLEVGSIATPFNRQSLAKSMADCQRYYEAGSSDMFNSNVTSGITYYKPVRFSVSKRAAPTISYTDQGNSNFPAGVPTNNAIYSDMFYAQKTANGTASGFYQFTWTASAEL